MIATSATGPLLFLLTLARMNIKSDLSAFIKRLFAMKCKHEEKGEKWLRHINIVVFRKK